MSIPMTRFNCPYCKEFLVGRLGYADYKLYSYGPSRTKCKKCSQVLPTGARDWNKDDVILKGFHIIYMGFVSFARGLLFLMLALFPILFIIEYAFQDGEKPTPFFFLVFMGVPILLGAMYQIFKEIKLIKSSFGNPGKGPLNRGEYLIALQKIRGKL